MLYVVAHLIITVAILAGYVYSIIMGAPDETLQTALVVIVGYWFGMTGDKVRNKVFNKGENNNGKEIK